MRTDDSSILAEQFDCVQKQYKQAKDEVKQLESQVNDLRQQVRLMNFAKRLKSIGIACVVAFLVYLAGMWMLKPPVVDHCYIDSRAGGWNPCLWGHVSWGMDRNYGCYSHVDHVIEEAKAINCPIR